MIQVHITPTKPEYSKYITMDYRFICKRITVETGKIIFYDLWDEGGWQKTLNMEDGYFEVDIKRVEE